MLKWNSLFVWGLKYSKLAMKISDLLTTRSLEIKQPPSSEFEAFDRLIALCIAKGETINRVEIEELLLLYKEAGFNFNPDRSYNQHFLIQLAKYNLIDVGKLFIKFGTDVNYKINGSTLLCEAVRGRDAKTVEYLILCGADPNITKPDSYPPLVIATGFNDIASVKALLKHSGLDINIKTQCTAFYAAAQQGNDELLDLLFQHKANALLTSSDGYSPLHAAAANNRLTTVKKLCAMVPELINQKGECLPYDTVLHVAVYRNFIPIITVLLENGADVNAMKSTNISSLYIATFQKYTEVAKILLMYGADTTIELGKNSALYRACQNLNRELVELLLNYPHSEETLKLSLQKVIIMTYHAADEEEHETLCDIAKLLKKRLGSHQTTNAWRVYPFLNTGNQENLQRKLQAAIKYAKDVCVLGSGNKIEDIVHTSGWSRQNCFRGRNSSYKKLSENPFLSGDKFVNLYLDRENRWRYKIQNWFLHVEGQSDSDINLHPYDSNCDPIKDTRHNLHAHHETLFKEALFAINARTGTCGIKATLVAKYLWEHSLGINRIEIILMQCDHSFVIVNRRGNLNDSASWGDAWVVDAWYKNGIIFSAAEFPTKIAEIIEYLKFQKQENEKIKIKVSEKEKHNLNAKITLYPSIEIYPHIHLYPRDNQFKSVEDYYQVSNVYPKTIFQNLESFKKLHQERFKQCIDEISSSVKSPMSGS